MMNVFEDFQKIDEERLRHKVAVLTDFSFVCILLELAYALKELHRKSRDSSLDRKVALLEHAVNQYSSNADHKNGYDNLSVMVPKLDNSLFLFLHRGNVNRIHKFLTLDE